MNGRVTIGKDGKRVENFLDPAKPDLTKEEIHRAKGYVRGAGKAFRALTPEQISARTVKAKPAAAAQPPTPVPADAANKKGS